MKHRNVIVTGAGGYIGSVLSKFLHNENYHVWGIDKQPAAHIVPYVHVNHVGDLLSHATYVDMLSDFKKGNLSRDVPVVHLAGSSLLGLSTKDPASFYQNNVIATITLVEQLKSVGWCGQLIFASTAAVYGAQNTQYADERSILLPINPYGNSKLVCEYFLKDMANAFTDIAITVFRLFNVAGGWETIGQQPDQPHIITQLCNAGRKKCPTFTLHGDGNNVRDFVHVIDVCRAICQAIEYRPSNHRTYNLGSSTPCSINDLITIFKQITNTNFPVTQQLARPNDPPFLLADNTKFRNDFGFEYKHSTLQKIITDAWRTHQIQHDGGGRRWVS